MNFKIFYSLSFLTFFNSQTIIVEVDVFDSNIFILHDMHISDWLLRGKTAKIEKIVEDIKTSEGIDLSALLLVIIWRFAFKDPSINDHSINLKQVTDFNKILLNFEKKNCLIICEGAEIKNDDDDNVLIKGHFLHLILSNIKDIELKNLEFRRYSEFDLKSFKEYYQPFIENLLSSFEKKTNEINVLIDLLKIIRSNFESLKARYNQVAENNEDDQKKLNELYKEFKNFCSDVFDVVMIFGLLDNINKQKNIFICCGHKHAEKIKEVLLQLNHKLTFSYQPPDYISDHEKALNRVNDIFAKIRDDKWGISEKKLKFFNLDYYLSKLKKENIELYRTPVNIADFWEKFIASKNS